MVSFAKLVHTLPLTLALAGCGGAQKRPTAPADRCGAAGANTARVITAAEPRAPATLTADIGSAVARHCRADGWTAQAQECVAKAADDKAFDLCGPMLTEAQTDAADKEIDAIVQAAGYGGAAYGGAAYGGPKL